MMERSEKRDMRRGMLSCVKIMALTMILPMWLLIAYGCKNNSDGYSNDNRGSNYEEYEYEEDFDNDYDDCGIEDCYDESYDFSSSKTILCKNDEIEILSEIAEPGNDDWSLPVMRLTVRDKSTGEESFLLKTISDVDIDYYRWGDITGFQPISIDSVCAAEKVTFCGDDSSWIIVEGCPDARNIYSFLIDVPRRKAWFIPANSGYLGDTEEGYMIFKSYRYVTNPEIGGRYTLLQVYDDKGRLVDTLDLEHVINEQMN